MITQADIASTQTTVLEAITHPTDLRKLTREELDVLAAEIRAFLVDNVSRTGGHLGPNLGVVELTIALHRIFESPRNRILWDTGHQAYVHKILTGGMAWEALNNIAAAKDRPVIIVVNDNARSYAPTIGGLAVHLAALRAIGGYEGVLAGIKRKLSETLVVDAPLYRPSHGLKEGVSDIVTGQGMFEDLGLKYLGPFDGHDIGVLETALRAARGFGGPVIVHCITHKGREYPAAEQNDLDRLHTVRPAAGLALGGLRPVVAVYATFLNRAPEIPAISTIAGMDVLYRQGAEDVLLIGIGAMAGLGLEVAERLTGQGIGVTAVDPRWIIPVSAALVSLAAQHRLVVTIEDNGRAGGQARPWPRRYAMRE